MMEMGGERVIDVLLGRVILPTLFAFLALGATAMMVGWQYSQLACWAFLGMVFAGNVLAVVITGVEG